MSKHSGNGNGADLLPPEVEIVEESTKHSQQPQSRVGSALLGALMTLIVGVVLFLITAAGAHTDARNDALTSTRVDVGKLQTQYDNLKTGQENQAAQINQLDGKVDDVAGDVKELKELVKQLPKRK